jgi:hypothetical protein
MIARLGNAVYWAANGLAALMATAGEGMIRQLSYDFRPWQEIEPTGRGGSDDGYDARAWEKVDAPEERDEDEEEAPPATRLWLIQCKREKQISPKKLREYLDNLPQGAEDSIYGIMFDGSRRVSNPDKRAWL